MGVRPPVCLFRSSLLTLTARRISCGAALSRASTAASRGARASATSCRSQSSAATYRLLWASGSGRPERIGRVLEGLARCLAPDRGFLRPHCETGFSTTERKRIGGSRATPSPATTVSYYLPPSTLIRFSDLPSGLVDFLRFATHTARQALRPQKVDRVPGRQRHGRRLPSRGHLPQASHLHRALRPGKVSRSGSTAASRSTAAPCTHSRGGVARHAELADGRFNETPLPGDSSKELAVWIKDLFYLHAGGGQFEVITISRADAAEFLGIPLSLFFKPQAHEKRPGHLQCLTSTVHGCSAPPSCRSCG
jgi:hypothetical protein